jgi:hypothetical protein
MFYLESYDSQTGNVVYILRFVASYNVNYAKPIALFIEVLKKENLNFWVG